MCFGRSCRGSRGRGEREEVGSQRVAMSKEVGSRFGTGKGFMLMPRSLRIYSDNIVSVNKRELNFCGIDPVFFFPVGFVMVMEG